MAINTQKVRLVIIVEKTPFLGLEVGFGEFTFMKNELALSQIYKKCRPVSRILFLLLLTIPYHLSRSRITA